MYSDIKALESFQNRGGHHMFSFIFGLIVFVLVCKLLFSLGLELGKILFSLLGFIILIALFPLGIITMALLLPVLIVIGIVSIVGFTIKLVL